MKQEPGPRAVDDGAAIHDERKSWRWTRPRYWGIPMRSALVSATVVLVALMLVAAGVAGLLYRQLLDDVDAAATRRVHDVVAGLQSDSAADLDPALLATDQQIVAVQIVNSSGAILRSSSGAPRTPMVPAESVGSERSGLPSTPLDADMRVSGQTTDGSGGRYTVLVAADSRGVESTVTTVVVLLVVAAPFVIAGAASATYVLVRRSLRSVDAMRSRVADISAHHLTERVPVPTHDDEISALAVTMNDMLARIESGQAAQRRFVSDASHELRSPLATIISALEVALVHPTLLDGALARDALLPEARRMQSLIDDLLLLARADERGLPLRRNDIDLDDLAGHEIARLRRETAHDVLADLTPARLTGDPDALSRVLRNLLENAARHATSRIEVSVWSDRQLGARECRR